MKTKKHFSNLEQHQNKTHLVSMGASAASESAKDNVILNMKGAYEIKWSGGHGSLLLFHGYELPSGGKQGIPYHPKVGR